MATPDCTLSYTWTARQSIGNGWGELNGTRNWLVYYVRFPPYKRDNLSFTLSKDSLACQNLSVLGWASWCRTDYFCHLSPQKILEIYIFQIINEMTTNKEEKGYDLETSGLLFLSLFCNASKNT